jgi:hypothetical protein
MHSTAHHLMIHETYIRINIVVRANDCYLLVLILIFLYSFVTLSSGDFITVRVSLSGIPSNLY